VQISCFRDRQTPTSRAKNSPAHLPHQDKTAAPLTIHRICASSRYIPWCCALRLIDVEWCPVIGDVLANHCPETSGADPAFRFRMSRVGQNTAAAPHYLRNKVAPFSHFASSRRTTLHILQLSDFSPRR